MIYHNSFLKIFLKKNINKDRFENNVYKKFSKHFLVSFSKYRIKRIILINNKISLNVKVYKHILNL